MARDRKLWLAAAAVLLLVGAGCESLDYSAKIESESKTEVRQEDSLNADIDAAVDASLEEAENDADEESADDEADTVTDDEEDIKAYGQVYDKAELQ